MFTSRTVSVGFSKYLSATSINLSPNPRFLPAIVPATGIVLDPPAQAYTNKSLSAALPVSSSMAASSKVHGTPHVRFSHTDVKVPSFDNYRRDSTKDSSKPASDLGRRAFTYMMVAGLGVASVHSAKNVVVDFVSTMSASADVLALAQIEIDINTIPEGKHVTFKWRGKPLFVRHRTPDEIEAATSLDLTTLKDPSMTMYGFKNQNGLFYLESVPILVVYQCPMQVNLEDISVPVMDLTTTPLGG